ncbi:uncharacterized protein LOC134273282 [Saccostrea cucullata]|uniref:uncharacterized protein LOC134273282 n=1 Tax=Saccostrea cuccullata TaxID=36930 RepID=UPI002ED66AAD
MFNICVKAILIGYACELIICQSVQTDKRLKREVDLSFKDKHVAFVKDGRKVDFKLLYGRLPKYARDQPNRKKHSFLLVPVKKGENVAVRKTLFTKLLNTAVSKSYRGGKCKQKRDQKNAKQSSIRKTCPNNLAEKGQFPDKENIDTSDYFVCSVDVAELGKKILLVEFNVQDDNECELSTKGSFTVGVGILKTVGKKPVNTNIQRKSTDWFLINHLDGSKLEERIKCHDFTYKYT